jgi:hypothetical protein
MTVLQELQKGYALDGRTVRPSSVIVSVSPEEAPLEQKSADEADPGNSEPPHADV